MDRALSGIGWPLACRQLPSGQPGHARACVPDPLQPCRDGGWGALHGQQMPSGHLS